MKKKRQECLWGNRISSPRARCLLVIVVLCFFSLFSSQVSAQENRNISINKQNVPFEEIVREVEAQTDYSFMYSTETVQSIGSNLNDFVFCPVSIYFHKLYGNQDNLTYQSQYQINGTKAHEKVDNKKYSTRKSVKMALDVYSDEYKIVGKIDLYDEISKTLIERKKFVKKIYDYRKSRFHGSSLH